MMYEFRKQKLDVKYQKKIEEWKKYKREEAFAKKLDRQMKEEIERFINNR